VDFYEILVLGLVFVGFLGLIVYVAFWARSGD
jgi:hypothetical protein